MSGDKPTGTGSLGTRDEIEKKVREIENFAKTWAVANLDGRVPTVELLMIIHVGKELVRRRGPAGSLADILDEATRLFEEWKKKSSQA